MGQESQERDVLTLTKDIKLIISLFLLIRVIINSEEVINKVVGVKGTLTLHLLHICYYHL